MEDERIEQIKENMELIEKCGDTLEQIERVNKLIDKMVGEE